MKHLARYPFSLFLGLSLSLGACLKKESQPNKPKKTAQAAIKSDSQSGVVAEKVNPLIHRFVSLRAQISQRAMSLSAEKSRRSHLLAELAGKRVAGCAADVELNTITLRVGGQRLEPLLIAKTNGYEEQGKQALFRVTLSTFDQAKQFSFVFDEFSSSLFHSKGEVQHDVSASKLRIADLDQIIIEKLTATKKTTSSKNYETQRYMLHELKLLANGHLFFERSGIDHSFSLAGNKKNHGLFWSDQQVAASRAYRSLMQRQNCTSLR